MGDILQEKNGKPKGDAYVRYATEAEAQAAISQLNDSTLDERTLKVDPWTGPKPKKQQQGGRGGGFGAFGGAGFPMMPMNPMQLMMMNMMGMMGGGCGGGGNFGGRGGGTAK